MGITMFGFGGVMASMHGLMASWFAHTSTRAASSETPPHTPETGPRTLVRGKPHLVRPGSARACSSRSTSAAVNPAPSRTLRVVRVMESRHARSGAGVSKYAGAGGGRMVISGRMADVCAELDRLDALEAAAT